jgi:hypothetical protein
LKYFKYDLWKKMQGEDSEAAERAWMRGLERYRQQFQVVGNRLGNAVQKFFLTEGLHDGLVEGVSFDQSGIVQLVVRKNGQRLQLSFMQVGEFRLSYGVDSSEGRHRQNLRWGYEEFSERSGALCIDVLFVCGAEMHLLFESLRLRKLPKALGQTDRHAK